MSGLAKGRTELRKLQRKALAAYEREDWTGLKKLVESCSSEAAYFLLKTVGRKGQLKVKLHDLVRGPDDATGLTIAGALTRERSSRYRGGGRADEVTEKQWDNYLPTLAVADQLLCEALDADPSHGLAAAYLMGCRIDSEPDEKDDAEARLLSATNVPPSGYLNLMMARSEKWGGSHSEMWSVANTHRNVALPGSLALAARAYFENWLYIYMFEKAANRALVYSIRKKPELLKLSREIRAASDDSDPAQLLLAHNWIAVALAYANKPLAARPHLRRIGSMADPSAWYLVPIPPRWQANFVRLRGWMLPT